MKIQLTLAINSIKTYPLIFKVHSENLIQNLNASTYICFRSIIRDKLYTCIEFIEQPMKHDVM
jgi:hypothetical protein